MWFGCVQVIQGFSTCSMVSREFGSERELATPLARNFDPTERSAGAANTGEPQTWAASNRIPGPTLRRYARRARLEHERAFFSRTRAMKLFHKKSQLLLSRDSALWLVDWFIANNWQRLRSTTLTDAAVGIPHVETHWRQRWSQ